MPVGFTKVSATSNRLVYKMVGDGATAASSVSKSNIQLLADAVDGPLKDLIAASYADTAAVQAVFGGGSVEVSTNVQIGTSGFIALVAPIFTASANKPVLGFGGVTPANADEAFIVIEHKHSIVQ